MTTHWSMVRNVMISINVGIDDRISQREAYSLLSGHRRGPRSHDTRRIHCILRGYASSLVMVSLISISVYIFLIDEVSDIHICFDACMS